MEYGCSEDLNTMQNRKFQAHISILEGMGKERERNAKEVERKSKSKGK